MKDSTTGTFAEAITRGTFPTFKQLEKRLKLHFGDLNAKATAQHALQAIKQGNMIVEDYIDLFESYKADTEFDQEVKILYFKRGLKPFLQKEIYC
jgi:hypothetical protein